MSPCCLLVQWDYFLGCSSVIFFQVKWPYLAMAEARWLYCIAFCLFTCGYSSLSLTERLRIRVLRQGCSPHYLECHYTVDLKRGDMEMTDTGVTLRTRLSILVRCVIFRFRSQQALYLFYPCFAFCWDTYRAIFGEKSISIAPTPVPWECTDTFPMLEIRGVIQ